MGEYSSEYAQYMAPAFIEGLVDVGERRDPDVDPIVNIFVNQIEIVSRLRRVDWEATGLPGTNNQRPEGTIGEVDVDAGGYAERLTVFAFDDAYSLIDHCKQLLVSSGKQLGISFGASLQNSKPLLSAARLNDGDKSDLFLAVKHPDIDLVMSKLGMDLEDGRVIELLSDKRGVIGYRWLPEVQAWIDDRLQEDEGCPAARQIITTKLGGRMTMLNYFWDQLIEAGYPADDVENNVLEAQLRAAAITPVIN